MVLMSEDFESKIKDAVDSKPAFAMDRPGMSSSPPVFVKVDRYKELLQDIRQAKQDIVRGDYSSYEDFFKKKLPEKPKT